MPDRTKSTGPTGAPAVSPRGGAPAEPNEPNEPSHVFTLGDGGRILVRPLLASDRDELVTRYAELSAESRRLRFGSAPVWLSPRMLDHLVELDYHDRFAWVAVAIDDPGEPGIGVARYVRSRHDPTAAEAAVTVLDAYQHRGIGSTLIRELVKVARKNGITTFTATVMWENAELLEGLRSLGATVEPEEPGVAAVRIKLPEMNSELHESMLFRLLRMLAVRLAR